MLNKRLIINSKDRGILSTSSSDFVVRLHDPNLQSVARVTVESVSVSNLVYNINESNNVLHWTEDNGSIDNGPKIIPVGQYDLDVFTTTLQTLLNATGTNTFVVEQENHTSKFKITNTSAQFQFLPESTAFDLIGLAPDSQSVVTGTDNVLRCAFTPDLGGVDKLYIHSKTLAEYNTITSSVGSASILTYVSFHDTAFGNLQTRFINDAALEQVEYSSPKNLNNIDIKVRDENGRIVDLQNSNVVVVLKVYY